MCVAEKRNFIGLADSPKLMHPDTERIFDQRRGSNGVALRIGCVAWILTTIAGVFGLPAISWGQRNAMAAQLGAVAAPVRLETELRANPSAINSMHPQLSWVLPWKGQNQSQRSYEILVASSLKNLAANHGNLWNSGRIRSKRSIGIRYAGIQLSARQRCFWKVRVWNQANYPSRWSQVARWREGLLSLGNWQGAHWIGWERAFAGASWILTSGTNGMAAPVGYYTFYRRFVLPADQKIISAVLVCGADNAAIVCINGKLLSRRLGSPFNAPGKFVVQRLLKPGANRIAVLLQNQGTTPNPAGLVVALRVSLANGATITIVTNRSWAAVDGKPWNWRTGVPPQGSSAAQVLAPYGGGPWGSTPLPAIYLRDQFTITKPVRRAVAYFCGLGLGRMYINGQRASRTQLSPALSWYPKRCYYVARNVTTLLRLGKNAIGVVLGNGRMYGMPGSTISIPPRMIFMLHIRYSDGTTSVVTSSTKWKMTDVGPIRMNNEYNGEAFDARMRMPNWDKAHFDDASWLPAQTVHSPGGRLVAEFQPPIRITQTIHPVALLHIGRGQYIYDMGQNMAGWCQIRVDGPVGTTITLRYGEALTRNGHRWMPALGPEKRLIAAEQENPAGLGLYTANLRSAQQTDTLILNGQPTLWHPIFTYHGFRYVELIGYPGRPTLSTLDGMEVHDALPVTGGFVCSDRLVNQIFNNCRWGIQDNYRSIPTDCPQRDERQGWMGDRSAESYGEMFIFNVERFYNKWLWDIQDGQHPDGDIADVNPPYWAIYIHDVTWPSTFLFLADNLYLQYGETSQIRQHYAAMVRWINYQLKNFVHNGVDSQGGFGDWDPPPREHSTNDGSRNANRSTSGPLLATATMYKDLRIMARFAKLLHKPADRHHWMTEARRLYDGFNQSLWNVQGGYYGNGSDTSGFLPLAVGIVPPKRRAAVIHHLLWSIRDHQRSHFICGLIGMQWAFQALDRIHENPLAWTWLNKTTYPSYGYMIKHGATTVWENWNGNTAGPGMNSMNHVMFIGDLLSWLFEDVGGIESDPDNPGFQHIIMRPQVMPGLTWVNCWHRSPYGKIVSDWKITPNHRFLWHVEIPANSSALVEIPARAAAAVRLDSNPPNHNGIKYVRMANGRALYQVQSGTYNFSAPLSNP